jgi:predicted RNase H-like nuclease (RuvC/YqgF family)
MTSIDENVIPSQGGDDSISDDGIEDEGEGNGEGKGKKRKERLEQNRISARESRKRKKTMIEELQRTVITLSRENKELNERNEGLRRQLMEIGAKVSQKKMQHHCFPGHYFFAS